MDLDSFLVSLYVLVDDWWQDHHCWTMRRPGRPTLLSDSEEVRSPVADSDTRQTGLPSTSPSTRSHPKLSAVRTMR